MKPGYKQTEVGVIPEEWEVKPLGHICSFENGDRSSNYPSPDSFRLSGIPFINAGHVADGEISANEMNYITQEAYDRLGGGKVKAGDILFCLRGSLGKFGLVSSNFGHGAIASSLVIVRPKDALVSREYLCCYFGSALCTQMIETWAGGAAQPNLGAKELARFSIQRPPLPEQRAIATALSDVDGLLGGLDRLIAKKRDLKQAAMQQLLTGQTRLPGFRGEWEVKRLGDVGKFLKGSGVTKDQTRSGSLACVRYGELYTQHNDVVRGFHSWISPAVAVTAVRLEQGDILFAGSGETKEEIGKCAAFVSDIEAYAGGDIVILRPNDGDSVFLGYYLNTGSISRQKASRGQGDAVVHISSSALSDVRCKLPPLPEQTAIASVLSEMDGELAALEQRREKTRALKQAMMQELLTGRTRLV